MTNDKWEKMNDNERWGVFLMGVVASITAISAGCKAKDPRFTWGGEKMRTPFMSSLFFIVLFGLSVTSIGLIVS